MWIPRRVPVFSHHTQDGLLCGGRPRSRRRLLSPIPRCYPACNQEGPDPGRINLGIPDIIDSHPQPIPHSEDSGGYFRHNQGYPADEGLTTPLSRGRLHPPWNQPSGYSGRTTSAVTGKIYTVSPGPAQHYDRPVSAKGLCGAIKAKALCPPSSASIKRVSTYKLCLFSEILYEPRCYHVNDEFRWLLICVTVHCHPLSL